MDPACREPFLLSRRRPGRSVLGRFLVHLLVAALVLGLVPIPAQASIAKPSPPELPPFGALGPTASEPVPLVVIVVADPSGLTKTAFGELIAHTGPDPQPYAFAGEPYDPNVGFQYHRARWMDPRTGRFVSVDPYAGHVFDPPSLHRYLYAAQDPTNRVDPTGLDFQLPASLTALSGAVTVAISNFGARLAPAFARGGPVLGRLFQELGRYGQAVGQEVLLTYQRLRPALQIFPETPAGRRVIDFFVRMGQRSAWIEMKYGLPWSEGEALTRLVDQVRQALATGQGQAVLWSLREPVARQIGLVTNALGSSAGRVQIVSGVQGLFQWLVTYFGPV